MYKNCGSFENSNQLIVEIETEVSTYKSNLYFLVTNTGIENHNSMVTMKTKLKIFQMVQKDLATIGYNADNPINSKLLSEFLKLMIFTIFECVYLCHDAETPQGYMDSMLMATVIISICISFVSTVQKTAKIFIFIDEIENGINESELNTHTTSYEIISTKKKNNDPF